MWHISSTDLPYFRNTRNNLMSSDEYDIITDDDSVVEATFEIELTTPERINHESTTSGATKLRPTYMESSTSDDLPP